MDYKNETINQLVSLLNQLEPSESENIRIDITNYDCADHLEAVRFVKNHTGKAGRQYFGNNFVWHRDIITVGKINIEVYAFLK